MTERSHLPATIRARVHDGAIDRVSRFFNASVADAAAELIQNSRRSGATRLDVATKAVPEAEACGGTVVTVTDDGFGIADPAVLLSFGESGWDAATARREDPAGMGVYALSKRGCAISSRPATAGIAPMPGWRVELTPECFLGKQEARIVACEDAPLPSGTAISFRADRSGEGIRAAFAAAARHCPLAVTVNGEAVERKAFLDGAVHVERWRGLAFGVFDSRFAGFNDPDLNFHGLTLTVRLPSVDTIDGGTWSVRADVDACPELELVLPARREAVHTPFLDEMRKAARTAIYRAMRRADRTPALAPQPLCGCPQGGHRHADRAGRPSPLAPRHRRHRRLARHAERRAGPPRHPGDGGPSRDPGPAMPLARGRESRDRRPPVRSRQTPRRLRLVRRAGAGGRRAYRRQRGRRRPSPRCATRRRRAFHRHPHRARPARHARAARRHTHAPQYSAQGRGARGHRRPRRRRLRRRGGDLGRGRAPTRDPGQRPPARRALPPPGGGVFLGVRRPRRGQPRNPAPPLPRGRHAHWRSSCWRRKRRPASTPSQKPSGARSSG